MEILNRSRSQNLIYILRSISVQSWDSVPPAPALILRKQFFSLETCKSSECFYIRLNPNLNNNASFAKLILFTPNANTLYLVDNGQHPDQFSDDKTFSCIIKTKWDFTRNTDYYYELYNIYNEQLYNENGIIKSNDNNFELIPIIDYETLANNY